MRQLVIGVLGGMSAASTSLYYQRLNAVARSRLGGLHGASLLLRSVDFAPIAAMQSAGEWRRAGALLNGEARALERGGAEMLLLATNTMHCVADEIMDGVQIPLLHIGDATASAIARDGLSRPGLLATAFTMEQSFYTDRLHAANLEPIIPSADDRALIHHIIYEELCKDVVTAASRAAFEGIAARMVDRGADCLILGCTEIGMLLNASNVSCPVYDTTHVHCDDAIDVALKEDAQGGGAHVVQQTTGKEEEEASTVAALIKLGGSVTAEPIQGKGVLQGGWEGGWRATAQIGEQRMMITVRGGGKDEAEQQAARKLLDSIFVSDY